MKRVNLCKCSAKKMSKKKAKHPPKPSQTLPNPPEPDMKRPDMPNHFEACELSFIPHKFSYNTIKCSTNHARAGCNHSPSPESL